MDEHRVRKIVRKETRWVKWFSTALIVIIFIANLYYIYDTIMINRSFREVHQQMSEINEKQVQLIEEQEQLNQLSEQVNQTMLEFYQGLQDRLDNQK